jgi:hypothetical protein
VDALQKTHEFRASFIEAVAITAKDGELIQLPLRCRCAL